MSIRQSLEKAGRLAVSAASLFAGIVAAVLIQAVVSNIFDNLH